MFVCNCNAIRENELRDVARGTVGDAQACYAMLGKTPNCGCCLGEADEIVTHERTQGYGAAAA